MSVAEIKKISLKRYYNQTLAIQINFFLELMCILKSCCLHVLLSLVFSFLNRRGKVYSLPRGTLTHIPIPKRPYFKCDTAILLLQHGVDPNLYRLWDVHYQFSDHIQNRKSSCVSFDVALKTFLGAGYHITLDDRNDVLRLRYDKGLLHYDINIDEPLSLKQLCRSQIRTQLRTVLNDTTIFPSIEQLPIPYVIA